MIVASGNGEGVRLVLENEEARMLAEFASQVDEALMLGDAEDSAIERLFPVAYRDDAEASAEFAQYTREGLLDAKRAAARHVRDAAGATNDSGLVEIALTDAEAWNWLTFLTDLRLILAERIGVDDDGEMPQPRDDVDRYLRSAYEWIGFVQGSMLEGLDPMGS